MRNMFLGGLQSLNHPVMNRIRSFLLAHFSVACDNLNMVGNNKTRELNL